LSSTGSLQFSKVYGVENGFYRVVERKTQYHSE
jgi:hypothetical protein